jgi:uncharacterized MAPEG superfamily protein
MQDFMIPYTSALAACVTLGGLIFIQVLVADVAGMKAKHVPGMPVTEGHASFHFRAVRALANTNETLALFVLLLIAALLLQARPGWVNALVWTFTAARALHMGCYYARWSLARSAAFSVGLLAQFGLLIGCVQALF